MKEMPVGSRLGELLTRRGFICASALVAPVLYAFNQPDFWNAKDLADYTDEDKESITTNSPWARTVRSDKPDLNSVISVQGDGWLPPPCEIFVYWCPHSERKPAKVDAKPLLAFYGQVTVRWESAKPILQITGTHLPEEFRNYYVVAVTGLPPAFFDGTPTPTATLSSNRHRAVHAAHVFQHWSDVRLPDKRILLFAFQPGPADNGGRQVHRVRHESPRDNAEGTVRAATDDLSRPIGFVGLPFDLNQSRTSASSLVPDGMQRPTTR
jgi:hypothetical protein